MPEESQFVALGLVIRRHRQALKLTQEAFAHRTGLGQSYYAHLERGNHNVTLWNLLRIAEGLDVPASQLLRESENLDLIQALRQPPSPPRRGRPAGSGRVQRKRK